MATTQIQTMFLRDVHHGGPADQASQVAARLADYLGAATDTVDVAIYDFRLADPALINTVVGAFTSAAARGVAVRIAYDAGKPAAGTAADFARLQADPAPVGTGDWVNQHFAGTGVQAKPITAGHQLMHCKYVIRDGAKRYHTAAVWTGSTNFTDDAWTRQENNIITVTSETVAPAYLRDFTAMWDTGTITNTGTGDTGTTSVGHAQVGWDFAPGDGPAIDTTLTNAITTARDRIEIAAMVLTSHPMLAALAAAHQRGIPVTGIYDAGQMDPIESEWATSTNPTTATVLANWRTIKTLLAAKHSTPYTPTGPHDFMHNKILITDTSLFTGSYNFSANAEHNAENQLHVSHDQTVLAAYTHYLATITSTYQAAQ